jgi:nucleotide-binding universal stress UspA family protein
MAGEVVLGYDGTDCAKAALDVACSLASELDARLIVGYGYEPYHGAGDVGPHREALKERGREVTAEAVETAKKRGVDAEPALVADRSAPALAGLAADRDGRFIVVGSYGEPPLRSAILGSTPHKLLHISQVPVIVVPA